MIPSRRFTPFRFVSALLTPVAIIACADSTGVAGAGGVSLSTVAAPRTLPSGVTAGSGELVQTYGQHTLVIQRVALVLREIELERVEDDGCASDSAEDDCEEFETGPVLLELDLDGGIQQMVAIQAPAGRYDELQFEIHKPGDDSPADDTFLAANPDFANVSIRVEGTFDGEGFVFLQDLDKEQELNLNPPLEIVEDGTAANVTLMVDVTTWFVRSDGSLVDPRTANQGGPNESVVQQNIERSIAAFEDDERDGHDD